jgi:hypothetical protein
VIRFDPFDRGSHDFGDRANGGRQVVANRIANRELERFERGSQQVERASQPLAALGRILAND